MTATNHDAGGGGARARHRPPPPGPGGRRGLAAEMIRFGRDRSRIVSSLVQPVLFLFVLWHRPVVADRLQRRRRLRTFLFPGVLATSVLFTAAFSGISMVWDREFGFLREMLVAPVSTVAILTGKYLGGATVATLQSLIILALAGLCRGAVQPGDDGQQLVGLLFLMAFMICALRLFLSARVKRVQSAMPLVQLTITPLMFLSGSLFPLQPARLAARGHHPQPDDLRGGADPVGGVRPSGPDPGRPGDLQPRHHLGRLAGPGARVQIAIVVGHLPGPAGPGRGPLRPHR